MALREAQAQGGAPPAATWTPQMYNPENNRGGASMVAPSPAGAPPSLGAIQQQLSELPPLKKKRGRPTKAEMEARRERQRLELLAAQRIHGGDLPADLQDLQDPAEQAEQAEQARQKQEQDQQVQQQIREQENEQAHDSGQVHEEIEEDESEEGGPDSPDEED
jgi:hypothetical protein